MDNLFFSSCIHYVCVSMRIVNDTKLSHLIIIKLINFLVLVFLMKQFYLFFGKHASYSYD